MQRGLAAMEMEELKIGAGFGNERRERVRQNSVHSENEDGSRPRAPGADVDDPITRSQRQHRKAAGKQHERTGPQILVDRKIRMQQPPGHEENKPSRSQAQRFAPRMAIRTQPFAG